MNILNVNNILDPVSGGGTAERTLQLSRALQSRGADCTILTLDIGVNGELRSKAGNVRVVALPCRLERYFLPSLSWNTISELVYRADVVQLMNHWTILNAMVFHYLKRFSKPYVICPAGAIPMFGRSKMLKRLYHNFAGKSIIQHSEKIVAISPKEITDLRNYGGSQEKITLIPNGVDASQYDFKDDDGFRQKYGIPDKPFLLFMGRLNFIKGPDLLLDAFIRLVRQGQFPHHLVFAGPDAGMLSTLQRTSIKAGIADKVHFIGYIGGIDKSHALHAADFLAIPSRQEAMSIVVVEAGAAGLPVLITNECGFDDVTGIDGGVIADATSDGMYSGLLKMLENKKMMPIMGDNLRQYVIERFMWDSAARLYLDLFNGILNREA